MFKKTFFLLFSIFFLTNSAVKGQSSHQLQTPKKPLVLKAQGSFYVGGETSEQTKAELGNFGLGGHISINQMYVRYMIPQKTKGQPPVVMIHGMTLTGKTWESTPDGRMGWEEYFVRKGHSVYIPDQVGRGRSGFNQAVFNNVKFGQLKSDTLPPMWRFSDETAIPNFRIGSIDGKPHAEGQFPAEALNELSKQAVPDVSMSLPNPNPTCKALSDLSLDLKGTILISHSQSGAYPLEAALINPKGIKAMVLVEPGRCPNNYTAEQMAIVSKIPTLIVFGDYLNQPTGVPHSWQTAYDGCKTYVEKVNTLGGKAQVLHLPQQGIKGNSHMLMQDKNNLQVADLILKWIESLIKNATF